MSVAGFPLPSETQSKLCARKFLMETQKCQKTSWNSADIFRLSWYFLRRVYRSNFSKVSFFKIFQVPTLVWRSLHHPHAMTAGLTEDWRGTEGTGALFWAARRGARGTHLSAERSSTVLWLMGKRWGPGLPLDRPPKPFQVDERLTALGWGPPWGAIRHPRTDWGSAWNPPVSLLKVWRPVEVSWEYFMRFHEILRDGALRDLRLRSETLQWKHLQIHWNWRNVAFILRKFRETSTERKYRNAL